MVTLFSQKPKVASSMMATSNSLTSRICTDFSYLSANCPNRAENRKNGRMNNHGAEIDHLVGVQAGQFGCL